MHKNKNRLKKIVIGSLVGTTTAIFASATIVQSINQHDKNSLNLNLTKDIDELFSPAPPTPQVSLEFPKTIKYLLKTFSDAFIPEDPQTITDLSDLAVFMIKDLHIDISGTDLSEYGKAIYGLHEWYVKENFGLGGSGAPANFPAELKTKLLSDEFVTSQFKEINGIPEVDLDSLKRRALTLTFPTSFGTLISENLASHPNTPQINPSRFEHKVAVVNAPNVPSDNGSVEFTYQFGNNGDTYSIFLNNENDDLKNKDKSIDDLISSGAIIIRNNDKFDPDNPQTVKDFNEHLTITRDLEGKINFYVDLPSITDVAKFGVNTFASTWKDSITVGFLDSTINPSHIDANENSIISSNEVKGIHLVSHTASSYWKTDKNGHIGQTLTTTHTLKFYARPGEKFKFEVSYNGSENISSDGTTDGSGPPPEINFKVNDDGTVDVDKTSIRIPSSIIKQWKDQNIDIKDFEINTRTKTDNNGNIWAEIVIVTDDHIGIGALLSTTTPGNIKRDVFRLNDYGLDSHPVVFEKPVQFDGDINKHPVTFEKVVNAESEIPKLLGDMYLVATGHAPQNPLSHMDQYQVDPFDSNPYVVPTFTSGKLNTILTETLHLTADDRPTNTKLIDTNFGYLIEKLNEYGNKLNDVIKEVTGEYLFKEVPKDHFITAEDKEPATFLKRLYIDNKIANNKIIHELQVGFDVYENGPENLSNKNESIEGIDIIQKGDRDSLAEFAFPRLVEIVKAKLYDLEKQFNNKILDYKFTTIISSLYTSNAKVYKALNSKIIQTREMLIGSEKRQMQIYIPNNGTNGLEDVTTFKEQIKSLIIGLKGSIHLSHSGFSDSEVADFNTNIDIIIANPPERVNYKDIVVRMYDLLFKLIDTFSSHEENGLASILNIQRHIDKDKITEFVINEINNGISKINSSKERVISAGGFEVVTNDGYIQVANNNLHQIFRSFILKDGLTKEEKSKIQEFIDKDYAIHRNVIAELSIKSRNYDIQDFIQRLTGKDIIGVANEILELDPLNMLSSELPDASKFRDVIKTISENSKVVFGVIAGLVMLIGLLLTLAGFAKFKGKTRGKGIITAAGISVIAVGIALVIIIIIFPPTGALSLLAL